jgi:hypothetical protein
MRPFRNIAAAALAATLVAAPALAVDTDSVTFAQFTQQTSNKIVRYGSIDGGNSLTITESPIFFVISAFGPLGFYPTTMTMAATSMAAVTSTGPQFQQLGWSGNIRFGDVTTAYLDVNFANATFSFDGTGGSATRAAPAPAPAETEKPSLLITSNRALPMIVQLRIWPSGSL